MVVTENLMQFIWKLRLFNPIGLRSSDGEPLTVINLGQHNLNAGPDFLMSHIILGDRVWYGNIEIHIRSSDWDRHHHQDDTAYNNVILHVVWVNDKVIQRSDGTVIPTMLLSEYVDPHLLDKYSMMMNTNSWIPCQPQLSSVDSVKKTMWLDALSYERLEMKVQAIFGLLADYGNDWEKVFWIWMCRCMGLKVNAETFHELGEKLPLPLLHKYRSDILKIEAIFFGTAGFLPGEGDDEYVNLRYREFIYQQRVHEIAVVNGGWKKLRMRPYNFPEIRIAQLVALFSQKSLSLSTILCLENLEDARLLFGIGPLNEYWKYRFSLGGKASIEHSGKIGKGTIDVLLINVVVLFLFAYGKYYGIEKYIDRAIYFMESLPAEKNTIIKRFEAFEWVAENASQSQAILQLKKLYCDKKQCLHCRIGAEILRSG